MPEPTVTGPWRALTVDAPNLNYPAWSRDGRHVYATSTPENGQREVVRFDAAPGRVERVGRIDGLRSDLWLELTPDGAPWSTATWASARSW